MARLCTSLSAALVLCGAAAEALAQEDDGLHSVTEILPGTALQAEISDAYIFVKPVPSGMSKDAASPAKLFDGTSGGRVHLRANFIHVEEGAILSANGAGWQGVPNAEGLGLGGGGFLLPGPAAGGGAGAVGPGGAGSPRPACDGSGGPGGPAHIADPAELTLATLLPGSSGGAFTDLNFDSAGGPGGGVIILEASYVTIDGKVEARGGKSVSEDRPGGGGAGGVIFIKAYDLKLGPSAVLDVSGGAGSASRLMVAGGGGAGGVIFLQTANPPLGHDGLIVAGGQSSSCPAEDGAPGAVVGSAGPDGCLDLDNDDHAACTSDGIEVDCNDVDPGVNETAAEQCDDLNLDDDCNGRPDHAEEDQETMCGAGNACKPPVVDDAGVITEFASCVPAEQIKEDAPPETETVFFGGCGVGGGKPFAALATAALAAALLARWRRRKSA